MKLFFHIAAFSHVVNEIPVCVEMVIYCIAVYFMTVTSTIEKWFIEMLIIETNISRFYSTFLHTTLQFKVNSSITDIYLITKV